MFFLYNLRATSQARRCGFESGLSLHKPFKICALGAIQRLSEILVTSQGSIRPLDVGSWLALRPAVAQLSAQRDVRSSSRSASSVWRAGKLALRTPVGACLPGEFHGDIEYFYEVVTDDDGRCVTAYKVTGEGEVTRSCLRIVASG